MVPKSISSFVFFNFELLNIYLPISRLNQNPWGNFSGTYQLPDKLTRKFGDEYHKYLTRTNLSQDVPDFGVAGTRLTYPSKCETLGRVTQSNKPLHSCEKKDVR